MSQYTIQECTAEQYRKVINKLLTEGNENDIAFTQAPFYGAWQEADGKQVVYISIDQGDSAIGAGLGIRYDAPGGLKFLYFPYGPVVREWTTELYAALSNFTKSFAKERGISFVRLDSDGLASLNIKRAPNSLTAVSSLQPRAEWLLGITDTEAVWTGLHKHARYNVRLAERVNAEISFYEPATAPFDQFYSLMQTTGGRDGFSILPKTYYRKVFAELYPDDGFVAIVRIDGKPAAAALFVTYDNQCHYVFAGSSDEFRKIAPPYFLIWQSILEANQRSCHTFNFGGITDPVKNKHLDGVTGFKKRFGGYEVTHPNPVDLVADPLRYNLFKLYKAVRK